MVFLARILTLTLLLLLNMSGSSALADFIQTHSSSHYYFNDYYLGTERSGVINEYFTFNRYQGSVENLSGIVMELRHTTTMSAWLENWEDTPKSGTITYFNAAILRINPDEIYDVGTAAIIATDFYAVGPTDYTPQDPNRRSGPDYQEFSHGPETAVALYSVPEADYYKFTLDYYLSTAGMLEYLQFQTVNTGGGAGPGQPWPAKEIGFSEYASEYVTLTYIEKTSTPEPASLVLLASALGVTLAFRLRRFRKHFKAYAKIANRSFSLQSRPMGLPSMNKTGQWPDYFFPSPDLRKIKVRVLSWPCEGDGMGARRPIRWKSGG